jgi:spore coat protein SA
MLLRKRVGGGGTVLTDMSVALVAPGVAGLPPRPATSVEIYLYDLWNALGGCVDCRLYGKMTVLERMAGRVRRRTLKHAAGTDYMPAVLRDMRDRDQRPLVIQVDNRPRYVILAKQAEPGTPLVIGLHSLTFLAPEWIPRPEAVRALLGADAVVVNSRFLAASLERRFPEAKDRVNIIHPGVDAGRFHPARTLSERMARETMRRHYGAGQDGVILYAGRVIARKGVHVALQALRLVWQSGLRPSLWIAGARPNYATPYGRYLQKLAEGLPVRFLGYVAHERLASVYRAADVLICPSQMPEAYGLVNAEAQSSGLPVVASGAWGIRECVADGRSGRLVRRYRDPAAFAAALCPLLRDSAMRASYGRAARARALAELTWDRSAQCYRELYERLARRADC